MTQKSVTNEKSQPFELCRKDQAEHNEANRKVDSPECKSPRSLRSQYLAGIEA